MDAIEKLKGKTIYVGRDPKQNRLQLMVLHNNKLLCANMGNPDSVPPTVSRCNPQEKKAHCKIEIQHNGDIFVENLKNQNFTYVDGIEVARKHITSHNNISLGSNRYPVDMNSLFGKAASLVTPTIQGIIGGPGGQGGQGDKPLYNIKHLEIIWNNYHKNLMQIKDEQRQRQMRARIPMMFSMGGGAIGSILGIIFGRNMDTAWSIIAVAVPVLIALIGFGLFVKSMMEKDDTAQKIDNLDNWLMDNYVCPNPDHKPGFLGKQPYKIISQYTECPKCKVKYIS